MGGVRGGAGGVPLRAAVRAREDVGGKGGPGAVQLQPDDGRAGQGGGAGTVPVAAGAIETP